MTAKNAFTGALLIAAMLPLAEGLAGAQADEARFPVAHFHFGTVCRGFLYVSSSGVRYEVVQPVKDRNHSFQISRAELTGVQAWMVAGRVQNIAEIRTARAVYHFGLLTNDGEVNSGGMLNANSAAPAAALVAAIQNAGAGASPTGKRPSDGAALAAADPAIANAPDGIRQSNPPPISNQTSSAPSTRWLDGIYRSWNIANVANKQGSGFSFVTFYPDGRYLGRMPDQGMDVDDCAGPGQNLFCGNYAISGNTATVVRPPSQFKREPTIDTFTICQDGRALGPSDCHDERLVTSLVLNGGGGDLKLQGTFRRSDYAAAYSPRQGIMFTPDGRFADEGVLKAASVMHHDARGNYAFDDGVPGRGTYHIGHYTLTLRYSDGRIKSATFYMDTGTSNTDVREFYISTFKFTRVQ